MSKARLVYFEKDDVLHLAISDEAEAGSVEVSPNITAELNDEGELIGIEILSAGGGPRCLDSLTGGISSESVFNFKKKHQAASANG